MNWTKGPWRWSHAGPNMRNNYSQHHSISSLSAERPTLVGGCFVDVDGGEEVAQANARLIAAAPELYEALNNFMNVQREIEESRFLGDDDELDGDEPDERAQIGAKHEAAWVAALAALKKARGEQS